MYLRLTGRTNPRWRKENAQSESLDSGQRSFSTIDNFGTLITWNSKMDVQIPLYVTEHSCESERRITSREGAELSWSWSGDYARPFGSETKRWLTDFPGNSLGSQGTELSVARNLCGRVGASTGARSRGGLNHSFLGTWRGRSWKLNGWEYELPTPRDRNFSKEIVGTGNTGKSRGLPERW